MNSPHNKQTNACSLSTRGQDPFRLPPDLLPRPLGEEDGDGAAASAAAAGDAFDPTAEVKTKINAPEEEFIVRLLYSSIIQNVANQKQTFFFAQSHSHHTH